MEDEAVERAAALLARAQQNGTSIADYPDALRPHRIGDAYRIQKRLVQGLGRTRAGWKIGWTDPELQRLRNASEPMAGCMFADGIHPSGGALRKPRADSLQVEAEVVFELGRPLPHRDAPYDSEEVLDAVAAVRVGMEFVQPRVSGPPQPLTAIADNANHAFLVVGDAIPGGPGVFDTPQEVVLTVGGRQIAAGSSSKVLGNPANALVWLVDFLAREKAGLPAGAMVATGSWTGVSPVPACEPVVADFGSLGCCATRILPGDR